MQFYKTHYRLKDEECFSKLPNNCIFVEFASTGYPTKLEMLPSVLLNIRDTADTYNNILSHCHREAERMKVQAA